MQVVWCGVGGGVEVGVHLRGHAGRHRGRRTGGKLVVDGWGGWDKRVGTAGRGEKMEAVGGRWVF